MKRLTSSLLLLATLLSSCNDNKEVSVVTQKYLHKYGYAVSKEEWEAKNYPGQVVTTLQDSVTVVSTYEDGVLHGPTTQTYPQSQTLESYKLYTKGVLTKEVQYDVRGLPKTEIVYTSPSQKTVTLWFDSGSPLSIEEYVGGNLVDGQYFSTNNEMEARVVKGKGQRILRNRSGLLLAKELIGEGIVTKKETFHANGTPESISFYSKGKLTGQRNIYNASGEPEAIEHYENGLLNGLAVYFKNGYKFLEVSYLDGLKNGDEMHYIDGSILSQRITWVDDKKHGPSTFFVDGAAHTKWYHNGALVSHRRFEELCQIDDFMRQSLELNRPVY